MSFSVFSQNPTVINDSLVVNQRLYAKEKLIVDKEAKFKQDVIINGDLRLKSDLRIDSTLRVDGLAKFMSGVKMDGLAQIAILDSTDKIIIIQSNGQLKKVELPALQQIIYGPYLCTGGDVPNPQWSNGLNKIFSVCDIVNVGIGTSTPAYKLDVKGTAFAMKYLCGNSGATSDALFNGFSLNGSQDLIQLGLKIGAGTQVVRFTITNKGAATINNGGNQPSLTVMNGTGHAAVMFANDGTKILQLENSGLLRTREIRIDAANWADFVFDKNYNLPELKDVAKYIDANHRLPGIPSSAEMQKTGINVGEMQTIQMQKIEELTLYLIEMNEKMESMQMDIDALKEENEGLKKLNQK